MGLRHSSCCEPEPAGMASAQKKGEPSDLCGSVRRLRMQSTCSIRAIANLSRAVLASATSATCDDSQQPQQGERGRGWFRYGLAKELDFGNLKEGSARESRRFDVQSEL